MSGTLYWVMLASLPKVGPGAFRRLVDYFGSAEEAALASAEDHARAGILKPGQIDRLAKQRAQLGHLEHYLDEISFDGIRILTWESPDYPTLLRGLRSAPPVLYARGDPGAVEETTMAVIGTRSPTDEGRRMAYALAAKLAELGVTIVSGLADGIDTAGHRGALDAGGLTAAILGSGLLRISPKESEELAGEV
ncbi:MAG TPA: DNA-processing protein DprA, partial [Armatimonadota bacterium]|nr:DNA-processing protein DprA [Armatimonadota bacterium]